MNIATPATSHPLPPPAPSPQVAARVRAVLRAYAWAGPRLGALSVEIAAAGPQRTVVLLRGAAWPTRIVVGYGSDLLPALDDAVRNAGLVRNAFLHLPAPSSAPPGPGRRCPPAEPERRAPP